MGICVDKEKCIGCGVCVNSCAMGAFAVNGTTAVVNDDRCALCGVCVESCPLGAISINKNGRTTANIGEHHGVLIYAQTEGDKLSCVARELVGKGKELCRDLKCRLYALLLCGGGAARLSEELFRLGADAVVVGEGERYAEVLEETFADAFEWTINRVLPEIVLIGATSFGRSLAPKIAARMRTGLTADCTGLDIDKGTRLLRQTRPAFGGNLMATIICEGTRPQMATVRAGVFAAPACAASGSGEIIKIPGDVFQSSGATVKIISSVYSGRGKSIADARIIVAAGRGIEKKSNMKYIEELAERLGGSYGVSRPLVDMGWAEQSRQIGQTGCNVAPELLIVCGISGAVQHLAGISGAKTVVAVNSDSNAPIFSRADYKVVCNCIDFVKEMIETLKSTKTNKE